MNTNLIKQILLSLAIFIFGAGVHTASALTLSPSRLEIKGNPGATVTADISLTNDNPVSSQTYYVSYANFESQGESGTPVFTEPNKDIGTWMNADESITISPGTTKTIKLSITIPSDAYPGGHFGVIFFGTNPNSGSGGQVSVGAKAGILVLLSVLGDSHQAGGLVDFNTKDKKFWYTTLPVTFEYRFKNDGDDRIKPEGTITMRNGFYFPTDRINANAVSGNILPHSTRLFSVDWIKHQHPSGYTSEGFASSFFDEVSYEWRNFALGPYVATIDLGYGADSIHTTKTVFFFVFPWQLVLCLIVVFGALFYLGKKGLRRYNAYIIKKTQRRDRYHTGEHE